MASSEPPAHRYEEEKFYVDPSITKGDSRLPFPRLQDQSSLLLSVIVPAYNEEKRRECILLVLF